MDERQRPVQHVPARRLLVQQRLPQHRRGLGRLGHLAIQLDGPRVGHLKAEETVAVRNCFRGNVDLDQFNGSLDELRAFAGGGATPGGPCAGRYGDWCGSEIGLDADTLYACDGSSADASVASSCDEGCKVNPPGVNDRCYTASCAGKVDGAYCGSDWVGGNPALLYSCVGGNVDSFGNCGGGCVTMPAGTDDYCN